MLATCAGGSRHDERPRSVIGRAVHLLPRHPTRYRRPFTSGTRAVAGQLAVLDLWYRSDRGLPCRSDSSPRCSVQRSTQPSGRFRLSLEHLLEIYGYPVLFAGTFLEGETPLLMAGFLSHRGYFAFPLVVLVAFAGTFSADQLFFHLGRSRGRRYLLGRPAWQANSDRANALLQRYGTPLVIGFRFLYGLRIATPFVVGMSGFKPTRFIVLNAIGGFVWSVAIAALGYSLGGLLSVFLDHARRYEVPVLVSILLVSSIVWLVYLRRRSSAQRDRAA